MSLILQIVYFDIAYVLVTALLYVLAFLLRSPRIEYYARLLASTGALVMCACYGVVASIVLKLAGESGLSQWTTGRSFKWAMWVVAGVGFDIVEGEEELLTRPAVFVGNHQTELDVLMLGVVFPRYCSVTAKKSLKYTPFLGWFMALSNTVFIDRGNRATARAAMDGAVSHMRRDRQSVFMFPEGTRSYAEKPELLPFKKGAFHLAVQAQVPIVPIVVANYSHVLSIKRKIFRRGVVPVKVLPAIPTTGLTSADVDALCQKVQDSMLKELVALSSPPNGAAHRQNGTLAAAIASGVEVPSTLRHGGKIGVLPAI